MAAKGIGDWISLKYYHYNLWTGLYMLDWWERAIFNIAGAFRSASEPLYSRFLFQYSSASASASNTTTTGSWPNNNAMLGLFFSG
jgi:hypothetical protein